MLVASAKSHLCCEAGCGGRFPARMLLGCCSDHSRIILGSAPHWKWRFSCFREISVKCWRVILRGRRCIRWCSRMTPVVPRIGNNVSHVTRISYDSHFAWQAQYSVMLEDDTGCSAHCKWHFICDDVELSLFVAGAVFGEIWNDSRSAKCCIFQ